MSLKVVRLFGAILLIWAVGVAGNQRLSLAFRSLAVGTAGGSKMQSPAAGQSQDPTGGDEKAPYMVLRHAAIEEMPPLEWFRLSQRSIRVRLMLAGPPPCPGEAEYGLLVDVDQRRDTGLTAELFGPLGVDARVAMSCNATTGQFASALGPVRTVSEPSSRDVTVELTTTVDRLPAVDFLWLPYARVEGRLKTFTRGGEAMRWAISERLMP